MEREYFLAECGRIILKIPQKGRVRVLKKIFSVFFLLLFSASISFFVSVVMLDGRDNTTKNGALVAEADARGNAEIVAKLSPAVVGVSSIAKSNSITSPASTQSMGSGIVLSPDGYILTNQHVVGEKSKLSVTLSDGRTVSAKRIWGDSDLDIAILLANAENLTPAPLGDSAAVNVGDPVLAIGNPLSLQFQRTVTQGIISAKNRTLHLSDTNVIMEDLLQTDASINPGNSGGPLINMQGEVIGINTIKAQNVEGMGFAIAINLCKPIVERTLKEGTFSMPYLGLYAYDALTAMYFDGDYPSYEGLLIAEVEKGSPAYHAGLRRGDIILGVADEKIASMANLREKLLYYRAGETIPLQINRNGTQFTATPKLEEKDTF